METLSKMDPRLNFLEEWIRQHSEFVALTILIIVGWIIRVSLAVTTGGMVHPDEIYQSLEIAHNMKYGYSSLNPEYLHQPWEFIVPDDPKKDGAARSYIFPLLFYYIFELCEGLGIPYDINGTLMVVRIFSASYCTLLIPIVYFLSKEFLPSQKSPHAISLFAAFLITFWFQFPFFGIRTLTNSFVTPLIFGALYLHLRTTKKGNGYSPLKLIVSEFAAGVLLGLACALRMDSVVFFVPFFLLRHQNNLRMGAQYFFLLFGFGVMFFVQGLTDLFFYGTFLASPINWYKFNILEGKSSRFGVQPFAYYFGKIFIQPFYSINFALLVGLLIYKIQKSLHKFSGKMNDEWFFAILELLIWILMSLLVLSAVEHKEERFIFSIFPLLMILITAAMKEYYFLIKDFYRYVHEQFLPKVNILRRPVRQELAFFQLGLFVLASLFAVTSSLGAADSKDWAFFHDVNKALEWVGDQDNSTGIIVFSQWFYTGGWTYLHKNISMKFSNDPVEDNRWRTLPREYNYLVTPRYHYWRHEGIKDQVNNTFRLIKTVDGHVDIWFSRN